MKGKLSPEDWSILRQIVSSTTGIPVHATLLCFFCPAVKYTLFCASCQGYPDMLSEEQAVLAVFNHLCCVVQNVYTQYTLQLA